MAKGSMRCTCVGYTSEEEIVVFADFVCSPWQVDKQWSAIAKRPYDPFLSDHGEDQVMYSLISYSMLAIYT